MGRFVELAATEISVTGRRGWQPPAGGLAPLYAMAAIVSVIIAVWLGAVTIATGSPFVAVFALSVLSIIAIGVGILVAKSRAVRPLIVRAIPSADAVIFGAGDSSRRLVRWLAPAGAVMLASLVALLLTGQLYGGSGQALFSGVGRFGSIAFFATGAAVMWPGIRAWRGSEGPTLTLSREGVALALPRTGGSAAWADIGGAQFVGQRATVAANTGSFSWAARDIASDPVVLVDLIEFYSRSPAARARIGAETIALVRSGTF